MSELKDKLTKEVSEIDKTISNEDEKAKVLSIIQEMISDFTKHIVNLTERQNELDEKVTEIYDMLTDIEEELVEGLAERLILPKFMEKMRTCLWEWTYFNRRYRWEAF